MEKGGVPNPVHGGRSRYPGHTPEPERKFKKAAPWTEEEHKLFLLGLKKYGRGDWRNISRNYVQTRTPTQVASHAQKYFIALKSRPRGTDKIIHGIAAVSLTDELPPSPSQSSSSTTAAAGQLSPAADAKQDGAASLPSN